MDALGAAGQGYRDILSGQAPSMAQMQLQQGRDAGIAAQMAMANSGGGPAAMRTAQYQAGDANQQMAGQAAMLRAQEMEDARKGMMTLGSQYGQMREQDIGAQKLGSQVELESRAQNDALVQAYRQMGMSVEQAQWAAKMELESKQADQHARAQATRAGIASAGAGPSPWWGLAGAGLSGAATIGASALGGN